MTGPTPLLAAAILVLAGCETYGGTTRTLAGPAVHLPEAIAEEEEPEAEPVAAEPAAAKPNAEVHVATGVAFPEKIGAFVRKEVVRYDADGRDMGASYACEFPVPIDATVYLYPAPLLTAVGSSKETVARAMETLSRREFAKRVAEILKNKPGRAFLTEEEYELQTPGGVRKGRTARFDFAPGSSGWTRRSESRLYLFCYVGRDWIVKFRFTHPWGLPLEPALAGFMEGFPFPREP